MTPSQFKPSVPKCWLFAASGVMWSAVGLMLGITAIGWLVPEGLLRGMGYGLAGLILTVGVLRQRFGRLAQQNIRRLRKLPARGCFFAFQAWKSYLIILIMITLGSTLRHLPIQRPILAVVYAAIGGALFLGSFPYYRHLLRLGRIGRWRDARRHRA
jgi:hypothetical protein